jgi:sulfite reductase alpha subunit-like flavoprotein
VQVRLGALVAGALDVAGASPRRFFFEVLRHFATDERERERLQYLSTPEGRDDLYRYNQREGAVTSANLVAIALHEAPGVALGGRQ